LGVTYRGCGSIGIHISLGLRSARSAANKGGLLQCCNRQEKAHHTISDIYNRGCSMAGRAVESDARELLVHTRPPQRDE